MLKQVFTKADINGPTLDIFLDIDEVFQYSYEFRFNKRAGVVEFNPPEDENWYFMNKKMYSRITEYFRIHKKMLLPITAIKQIMKKHLLAISFTEYSSNQGRN
ncbi:hypothetical protein D1614_22855 [Maribellus luteus]|uniref:Uncharacterized protein n=1 Tax=Maribellus luteus TaxID=2305463 RepID=A0A399SSS7_9BACT|nr:hypothetical protein [Maribellus luteus]RIJ45511.1 hypothetical protein D1614_22855 [Maribellus luteus]